MTTTTQTATNWLNVQLPTAFPRPITVGGYPRKLTWADFDKVPKARSLPAGPYAMLQSTTGKLAYTGVLIDVAPTVAKSRSQLGAYRLANLLINVSLARTHTWVVSGNESPSLLAHEQGHYDIGVLIARELHWRLDQVFSTDPAQLDSWVARLKGAIAGERRARVDGAYDAETNGGQNLPAQQRWNALIADCLNMNRPLPRI